MRCKYSVRNVGLSVYSDEIIHFFEARGFETSVEKENSRISISVRLKKPMLNQKIANVSLTRNVDDSITVEFESFEDSASIRASPLLSLLGGGVLTLKSLKASEILERLERDFWEMIDRLMGSF